MASAESSEASGTESETDVEELLAAAASDAESSGAYVSDAGGARLM
jgi:hypothetical protein